jgi:hypothetical protein
MSKMCQWLIRACAVFSCAVMLMGAPAAEPADQASAKAFVDSIYNAYLAKNSKGTSLDSDAQVRRYFASPLADAMLKDFAAARKANEVPMLDGDPFIDAQDWEISNLRTAVKTSGASTAVATANIAMFGKPRTITLDLVRTPDGWRISEIRAPSGSLRAIYKLQ